MNDELSQLTTDDRIEDECGCTQLLFMLVMCLALTCCAQPTSTPQKVADQQGTAADRQNDEEFQRRAAVIRQSEERARREAAQQALLAKVDEAEQAGLAAEAQQHLRQAFSHYLTALQTLAQMPQPEAEQRLRERIIKVAQRLDPPPSIPEEAQRHAAYARTAIQDAKPLSDLGDAVNECKHTLRLAPWWAEAYYNMASVLDKQGNYSEAAQNLKLYLLAAPDAPDFSAVKEKMFSLEFKAKHRESTTSTTRPQPYQSQSYIGSGRPGGGIAGRVMYEGRPEAKAFVLSRFPNENFCNRTPNKLLIDGNRRLLKTIEVGQDGGLKGAVVALVDIEDLAFQNSYGGTRVLAEFCELQPYTGIVVSGKSFSVENRDADPSDPKAFKGVLHNMHSFEVLGSTASTVFNIGLVEKGSALNKMVVLRKDRQGSFLRLQCDQHEFMQSFFLPVTNPYYAIAHDDGTFEINGVPPGRHRVIAWHPFAGRVETVVDVPEKGGAIANFSLRGQ